MTSSAQFTNIYEHLAARLDQDVRKRNAFLSAMATDHQGGVTNRLDFAGNHSPYSAKRSDLDGGASEMNKGFNHNVPFDSPLDQSLGSPASSRDFGSPIIPEMDFDFSSHSVVDAPLFYNHGTQPEQNNEWLSGIPLFGTELGMSPSQQQEQDSVTEQQRQQPFDFSFDSTVRDAAHAKFYLGANKSCLDSLNALNAPVDFTRDDSPSAHSNSSSDSRSRASELGVALIYEFARANNIHDTDALVKSLNVHGIHVSQDDVAEAIARASTTPSPASSPTMSEGSSARMSDQSFDATLYTDSITSQDSSVQSPSPAASPTIMASAQVPMAKATVDAARKRRSSVQVHGRHTGANRRFICEECGKHFDRMFNLKTHAMTHINPEEREKPFLCPWEVCEKAFSRKYDAERHYRSIHQKKGEIANEERVKLALGGQAHLQASLTERSNG